MSIYSKVQKNITSYYHQIQEQYSIKYMREATMGVGLLVVLCAGYFGNNWYVKNREEKAFEALSEVIHLYSQTQQTVFGLESSKDQEKIQQAWQDSGLLIEALYKEHSGSYLAPYFLIFNAEVVLQRDGDVDQAITMLDKALPQIEQSSELGGLFHLKRIKMGFDSKDEKVQQQAFKDLVAVSQDKTSCMQEEAMYLLGLYYSSKGQFAKAQETFKELAAMEDEKALLPSWWVALAQEKLGHVTSGKAE